MLDSSDAATKDQLVSDPERRRSLKRAVAPTTLVVCRHVVGLRLQRARPRASAERTVAKEGRLVPSARISPALGGELRDRLAAVVRV